MGQEGLGVTVLHAIILGLVQGLGEFLPISSSAHLVLIPWFFGWPESGLAFDVALHLGTLLAVTVYFWRDLLGLAVEGLTRGTRTPMGRVAWGIVIGAIPGAVAGVLLESRMEAVRNPYSIALLLAGMGLVLYLADRQGRKVKSLEQVTVTDVVLMGVGQAFAVIPGVSRSGSTITAGLMLGMERETAARVSFLLGWPLILGAGVMALRHMPASELNAAFFIGVAVSAISGYAVIAFLLDYLRRGSLSVFAWYRAMIAAITIAVALVRR